MESPREGTVSEYVERCCRQARQASRVAASLSSDSKNGALTAMASEIRKHSGEIKAANAIDVEKAKTRELSEAYIDRLELSDSRIEAMAVALEEIGDLPDPVGEIVSQCRRPGGFEVGRMRIPLGVIAMIYESRPNVTADASALCFKAGNATILRGGSDALKSNLAIASALRKGLHDVGIAEDVIQVLEIPDREVVGHLLRQERWIDLVIPRGGKGLIQRVVQESSIPVIKHYEGVCHVYIDAAAELSMAAAIAENAKVQRPGTCNAMETLLVHEEVAPEFLPMISSSFKEQRVEIRGCNRTAELIEVDSALTDGDLATEYLALICNIKVVSSLEEAIEHIERYGSKHTDVIVTNSHMAAQKFLREVDSSSVMVNASSRLADGGVYGLGAEIGISTDKLHAFGPMGIKELTTKKFIVLGNGSLRS